MEKDQEFVLMVVRELVDMPDAVKVERKVDEMGVLITLSVDPSDMGKIIGKEGRTAKAIRTLLRVLGAKNNSRVNLKIEEPEGGTYTMKEEGEQPLQRQPQADPAAAQAVQQEEMHSPAPVNDFAFETPQQPAEPEHENPTSIL